MLYQIISIAPFYLQEKIESFKRKIKEQYVKDKLLSLEQSQQLSKQIIEVRKENEGADF